MTARNKPPHTPPNSIEAEKSTLAAVLIDPDRYDAVAAEFAGLDPGAVFFDDLCAEVWRLMQRLHAKGQPLDIPCIMAEIGERDDAIEIIGFLSRLHEYKPTSANALGYARACVEKYRLRALQRMGQSLLFGAAKPEADAQAMLMATANEITALSRSTGKGPVCVADGLENAVDGILSLFETKSTGGLLTGLGNLDAILNGLDAGSVCVVAARPSIGKTALAINIAGNVARAGGSVLIHSLEMSAEALIQRMAFSLGGIEKDRILAGHYSQAVLAEKLRSVGVATHLSRIHIDGQRRLTHLDLSARVKAFKREHPLSLVVIDYLQLMTPSTPKATREAQVAECSREIKILAEQAGCPVIVLSQLSRAAEHDGTPSLAHLRESGAIEQDADTVILLSRGEGNAIAANVAKNRNGSTGIAGLFFDRGTQTFRDWAGNPADLRTGSATTSKQGFRKAPAAPAIEYTYDDGPDEQF